MSGVVLFLFIYFFEFLMGIQYLGYFVFIFLIPFLHVVKGLPINFILYPAENLFVSAFCLKKKYSI